MKFDPLFLSPQWLKEYNTKYPHGMSVLENIIEWIHQVNELIDYVNITPDKVAEVLLQWKESGLIEEILERTFINVRDDLNGRGVNLATLGAAMDGVTDDYAILQTALITFKHVVIPSGVTVAVSDTIKLYEGMSLEGAVDNTRLFDASVIKFIGPVNHHKSVVIIGKNEVDAEPVLDGSSVILKNLTIDAAHKAGFCLYASYFTNETQIRNLALTSSLEYNGYFIKGWYSTIEGVTSHWCRNNGLAFGMPLEYSDGSAISWTSSAPLVLNGMKVDNVRAIDSGRMFSVDAPGTYNPTNPALRRKGYGIGAGKGNNFRLTNFLSERSGGAGLYVYSDFEPSKVIKEGYLEDNAHKSGLVAATNKPEIILENLSNNGGVIEIENIYVNYNSGGIFHTGTTGRFTWLRNIWQPRFLKSLDAGIGWEELYSFVLKDRVYYMCGQYNTLESLSAGSPFIETVDTAGTFNFKVGAYRGNQLIYVKYGSDPLYGQYLITFEDGTTQLVYYPANTGKINQFVYSTFTSKGIVSIQKSGVTGQGPRNVTFKVVNYPQTTF